MQRIGTFFPRPDRVPEGVAVKFAPGLRRPTVYLLEGRPFTAQQDAAFIERFRRVTRPTARRTVWLPRGPAWLWTVELGGSMDEFIQIWEFPSEDDRRSRRAALWADPAWLDFADRFGPLIVKRSMRILNPVVAQR